MAIELPAGLAELLGQIQSGVRTGFQTPRRCFTTMPMAARARRR